LGKGSTTEAMRRGLYFLQDQLTTNGWLNLGSGGDTFTQSVVLRALAEVPEADYKWIQEGVDTLINKMNPDGSWGERSGETGSVESTALSLLALIAAGENQFVPTRLVRTALIDVQRQLDEITEERNRLREDFENRVQEVCGEVAQERNTLKKESQELRNRVRSAQEDSQKALELKESAELRQQVLERELELSRYQQESRLRSSLKSTDLLLSNSLNPSLLLQVVRALLGWTPSILAAVLVWWFWQWPPSVWRIIAFVSMAIISSAASWFLLRGTSSSMPSLKLGSPDFFASSDSSSLRYIYMDMASEWPPSLREEIAYRLLTEIAEMPSDIATRYAEDLTFRLDLPSFQRSQLSDWLRQALRLNLTDRRILFDQLMRTTRK
jgi:Skp family chaperone for outer membrane proteins